MFKFFKVLKTDLGHYHKLLIFFFTLINNDNAFAHECKPYVHCHVSTVTLERCLCVTLEHRTHRCIIMPIS